MVGIKKEKPHKALYSKKVFNITQNKIDKIVEETQCPKWMVIDKLLSSALGTKTPNSLDLSKWLKLS